MTSQSCAAFCDLPSPTASAPADVHGPWCVSRPIGMPIEVTVEGDTGELTVDCVRVWDAADGLPEVRLTIDVGGVSAGAFVRLGSDEARALAAELLVSARLVSGASG